MDMFHCLAVTEEKSPDAGLQKVLYESTFFGHLADETEPANKRSVVQVLARLQDADRLLQENFERIEKRESAFEEKVMSMLEGLRHPTAEKTAAGRGGDRQTVGNFDRTAAVPPTTVQSTQAFSLETCASFMSAAA